MDSSRAKADERKEYHNGQVMMNQSMNMMTGSVFMPMMMTVNWLVIL